jgi:hypothetical protein
MENKDKKIDRPKVDNEALSKSIEEKKKAIANNEIIKKDESKNR